MRLRLATLLLGVSFCLLGQTMTIGQLVSFIQSAVQLKQPDKQVAATLAKFSLSQRLDEGTIIGLKAAGAGPKTVEALEALRASSASLPAAVVPTPTPTPPPPPPPPGEEDQRHVIGQARDYALNYTKNLPDFLCTQVTRRYVDPHGTEFWAPQDTLTARVQYVDHHEQYKVVLVNNRMVRDNTSMESVGGSTSTGEFGSLMAEIFNPETQTTFHWQRWTTLRGRRMHVYTYQVEQARSQWHIIYQPTKESSKDDYVPAYHGSIFVDRDTQMVMRITMVAELPPSYPVQQAQTTLDYDFADISGHQFLLPLKAVVRMREAKYMSKNEVEFRLYRKFTAEATIKFDETPEPLPADKTEEQPAK